jgi:hypothetical protein
MLVQTSLFVMGNLSPRLLSVQCEMLTAVLSDKRMAAMSHSIPQTLIDALVQSQMPAMLSQAITGISTNKEDDDASINLIAKLLAQCGDTFVGYIVANLGSDSVKTVVDLMFACSDLSHDHCLTVYFISSGNKRSISGFFWKIRSIAATSWALKFKSTMKPKRLAIRYLEDY